MTEIIVQKQCRGCLSLKPLSEFYTNKNKGPRARCKTCYQAADKRIRLSRVNHQLPYINKTNKVCPKCGIQKPVEEYYSCITHADGLQSYCKPCQDGLTHPATMRYQHSPKGRAQRAAWKKTPIYKTARSRRERRRKLKNLCGVTVDQYEQIYEEQNGVCAICGTGDSKTRRLSVDHCHVGGNVRGLLCRLCNLGIGNLKDSPELLERAKQYLLKHRQLKLVV